MKSSKSLYFYLFTLFLFIGIVSFELFSEGMFMDGLYYSSISRNLAQGMGSFWKSHLSQTLFNEFYEHPPLAFGLQSLFFQIFGDSLYVERLYSLGTFFIVAFIMTLIWREISGSY